MRASSPLPRPERGGMNESPFSNTKGTTLHGTCARGKCAPHASAGENTKSERIKSFVLNQPVFHHLLTIPSPAIHTIVRQRRPANTPKWEAHRTALRPGEYCAAQSFERPFQENDSSL